jgi:hypothetical protein
VNHLFKASVEFIDLLIAEVIDQATIELIEFVEILAVEHVLVVAEDAHYHC